MAEPRLKQASVVLHRLPTDWRTKYSKPGLPCLKTEPDSQDFSNTGCSKVWSSSSEEMGSFSHLDTGHIKTEPDVADSIKQEPPFLQPCSRTEIQCLLSADLNCMSGLVYKQCEEEMDEVRTGECSQLQDQGFTKTDGSEVENDSLKMDVMTAQCSFTKAVERGDIHTDKRASQSNVKSVTAGVTHKRQKHNLCRKVLEVQIGLRDRQRIHRGVKPNNCAECGKVFSSSAKLKCHQLLHFHRRFVCGGCGKSFYQSYHLKTHQRVHSGEKPYSCSECGKSFAQSCTLKTHMSVHSGEKPYSCRECGKSFAQRTQLNNHWRVHSGEKPYICSECGKRFAQLSTLNKHRSIHSHENTHSYSECAKSFAESSTLKEHQRVHSKEKPYLCSECGKSFAELSTFNRHQRVHSGEKPYSCSECKKSFAQRCTLKAHQTVHSGERPFSCSECGKSFAQRTHLNNHRRVHSGEKPYSCSHCGKSFAQRSTLKAHQAVHSGERPYSCNECGKSFAEHTALNVHKRVHSGEKPYSCSHCKKSFTQLSHLKKHQIVVRFLIKKPIQKKKNKQSKRKINVVHVGKVVPHKGALKSHKQTLAVDHKGAAGTL